MFPTVLARDDLLGKGLRGDFLEARAREYLQELVGEDPDNSRRLGHYLLGVLNTPVYGERYHEEIQQDFPRVPRPRSAEFFQAMEGLGARMSAAFALDVAIQDDLFSFSGDVGADATSPKYSDGTLTVGKGAEVAGVGPEAWGFRCAGYQVIKSWFTAGGRSGIARRGRPLTKERIDDLLIMLASLSAYLECRALADELVESHGGWEQAFVMDGSS